MLTIEKKYDLDAHVYYYLNSQSNTTLDNSDDDNFIKTWLSQNYCFHLINFTYI